MSQYHPVRFCLSTMLAHVLIPSRHSHSPSPRVRSPAPRVAARRFAASRLIWLLALMLWVGCNRDENPAPGSAVTSSGTDRETEVAAPAPIDRVGEAQKALRRGSVGAAEKLLRQHLLESPEDPVALALSGDISASRRDFATATNLYRDAIAYHESPPQDWLDKYAQLSMMGGRPFDALTALQRAAEAYPNAPQIKFDLAGLAAMLGMPAAATPPLRWLVRHQQGDLESLLLLSDPQRLEPDQAMCKLSLQKCPSDLRPQYSLARLAAAELNWQEVADRLAPVIEKHTDFVPAHSLYGRALLELGRWEQAEHWHKTTPPGADESADHWATVGQWAQSQSRPAEAARAYWEAARLDEAGQVESLTQLATCLRQIGRDEEADRVADKVRDVSVLRDALATFNERKSLSQGSAIEVADALLRLGRVWEAEGWARLAMPLPNDRLDDPKAAYVRIRGDLTSQSEWQLPASKIASLIDLADLPAPRWSVSAARNRATNDTDVTPLRLSDQATERGLRHTCEISPAATREGHWIYQSVGGGGAVIDFDLDGWPDVALAMLDGAPMKNDSQPNRLFRNVAGVFREVGAQAGYRDAGFAQGLAVGDYNDDGFPDLFDCNIGQNRLYRNNGDGTFSEVSGSVGLAGERWTTSAVIADIDGDGAADLFEVGYCGEDAPYTDPCHRGEKYSTCTPLNFDAQPDVVYRGRGDGTFVDASSSWMDQLTPGRGLGVIAGQFDELPGLDLYVANDMTVNHLWSGGGESDAFRLSDMGAIRGVGSSGRSFSQASMGMAVGDPDEDGDLDFFLTHFADDYNTYYEQVSPGLWSDRSFQVGLAEPSMKLLGFGTEWIDFDDDGRSELIVANGHVDDVDRDDVTFRMPAQLFRLGDGGRWADTADRSVGAYFGEDHLGRALLSLDAQRDGKTDCLITHLYDPVSLLINETDSSSAAVGIVLQATDGQRDAIGATVSMRVGTRVVTRQLTAGDGYMCSNQRLISVGMGKAATCESVTVLWPSGKTQTFAPLNAGNDYLLVENADEPHLLSPHETGAEPPGRRQ